MKRIIQIGIIFISLGLFFSCGTTKVEPSDPNQEDKQTVVEPVAPENEDKSKEDVKSDSEEKKDEAVDERKDKSDGERKHPRKPKKIRNKKAKEEVEETSAPVIPVFDDWKYMGFGTEVPKEVEEAVKAAPVDFITDGFKVYDAESRTVILHTSGVNVDQAEGKLEALAANIAKTTDFSLEDYEAAEAGWVNLNLEYFTPNLQADEEGSQIYQALVKLLEQTYIAYQIFRCVRPLAAGVK